MYFKATLVIALALFGLSSAQVIGPGPCPANVNVVPDFNVERYLGTWYEYARFPNLFESHGTCNVAVYTLQDDGSVGVKNTMIDDRTGELDGIEGSAVPVENGKLLVTFPGQPSSGVKSNYWVLDTDYDTYSVVYSCAQLSRIAHGTYAWVLTRERQPSAETIKIAESVFARNNLPFGDFKVTPQSDCN